MASYVFSWTKDTWQEWSQRQNKVLTYVAGQDKRPTSHFKKGDEIFVISVKDHRLYLGGRLIVEGSTRNKSEVQRALPNQSIIDKEIYILADTQNLDSFRPNLYLDASDVRKLEFYDGENIVPCKFGDTTWMQEFRVPKRLAESSALKLRGMLPLPSKSTEVEDGAGLDASLKEAEDAGHVEDVRQLQAIKTRKGQADFRRRLMKAYGGKCCITGCNVKEVLEAAHINGHAKETDYSTSNGLLLRADIHTLFDLNLVGVNASGNVFLSDKLKGTEYWHLNGRPVSTPENESDRPDEHALGAQFVALVSSE